MAIKKIHPGTPQRVIDKLNEVVDGVNGVDGDVSEVESDITDIQGDITDIQGDVTTAQGDITSLGARVTALENASGGAGYVIDIETTDGETWTAGEGMAAACTAVRDAGAAGEPVSAYIRMTYAYEGQDPYSICLPITEIAPDMVSCTRFTMTKSGQTLTIRQVFTEISYYDNAWTPEIGAYQYTLTLQS